MELTEYTISKEFAIPAGFSSSGIQAKYYKDGFWYKKNRDGYEGLAEQICSDVLSFTNIQDYVPYEACRICGNAPSHTFGGRSRRPLKNTACWGGAMVYPGAAVETS